MATGLGTDRITLIEEEKVVSEDQESTETFKSYFAGLILENKGM